jgi:hypothetical protein
MRAARKHPRNGAVALQREVTTHTHPHPPTHTHTHTHTNKHSRTPPDAGGVRSSGTPGATMQRGRAAPRQLRANKQIDNRQIVRIKKLPNRNFIGFFLPSGDDSWSTSVPACSPNTRPFGLCARFNSSILGNAWIPRGCAAGLAMWNQRRNPAITCVRFDSVYGGFIYSIRGRGDDRKSIDEQRK